MTSFTGSIDLAPAQFVGSIDGQQVHRFDLALDARAYFGGSITYRIPKQVDSGLYGKFAFTGSIDLVKQTPFGAFRDFSHYADTMADPAMVLIGPELSGQTTYDSAAPSNMRRVWVTVTPPREYPTKTEAQAWPRAAFASVGVRVNAMDPGTYQYIDGAQVEVSPLSQSGPTAYAPARSLNIKVKPDRLNYCSNPKLDANATGYSSNGTITRAAQGSGWAASVDGSVASYLASAAATSVVGSLWAAKVTLLGPAGKTGTVRLYDGTGYISGTVAVTFTGAPQEVTVLSTAAATSTSVRVYAYPTGTWSAGQALTMTRVLLERVAAIGGSPGDYFDGGFGADYVWEAGKAEGNGASFYYRDRLARSYLLQRILKQNCPLGVIPAVPQFAVLPSE